MTTPTRKYLKDYQAPDFKILDAKFYFNLDPKKTLVRSFLQFEQTKEASLVLNGRNLKLMSLKLNEKELMANEFQVNEKNLTIFKTPKHFTLQIEVEINPSENYSCEGLHYTRGMFSTQCEAESFQKITYFLDRPDVMTIYTVEIEADEKQFPYLLSNGNCIEKKSLGHGRHYAKWQDPFKKPCYLFALVAGDMGVIRDTFTTKSGRLIKLEIYAPHGKQDRCQFAMTALKKSMKWDEDRFGLEYDLDLFMIVSSDDFNMGAMENKGLNIFNSRLVLADNKTATDNDFQMVESVIGHEYFHNWTGNRVTCRSWFELSLKEGLTVYRDQEFSADMNSRSVQRIKDVDSLRMRQFSEDAGPNAHPVRPESCLSVDNFYTATIYEKGAEVIRMMATLVGRNGFRKGMDEYFKRHDGQAVTIDDFTSAISEANQQDFTQFKLWYSQAGTPIVTVETSYNPNHKKYSITLAQDCPLTAKETESGWTEKKPFVIPLKFGLIDSHGQDMTISDSILILKTKNQTWTFDDIQEKPVLSLNREFSAPVRFDWNRDKADLVHQMKYDTDDYNRRDACTQLILNESSRLIQNALENKELNVNSELIEALGVILNDTKIDAQFKSMILSMPADLILAQEEKTLDGKVFWNTELRIVQSFVKHYEQDVLKLYNKHHALDTPADRSLKNLLLRYLLMFDSKVYSSLAYTQFKQAKNMTEQVSAVNSLCLMYAPDMQRALDEFYQEWKNDAVVFNKWLTAQAHIKQGDAFSYVLKCADDPHFDNKNPNNLYALHRAFALNFKYFYSENQSIYKWFCDEILRVDEFNPQVAARLAQAFNFVQKLPPQVKNIAQNEINRILAHPKLSNNVRELLEKI